MNDGEACLRRHTRVVGSDRLDRREHRCALARTSSDRAALDGTEALNKHTVLATMNLTVIELEAEHTFLTVLADNQGSLVGAK